MDHQTVTAVTSRKDMWKFLEMFPVAPNVAAPSSSSPRRNTAAAGNATPQQPQQQQPNTTRKRAPPIFTTSVQPLVVVVATTARDRQQQQQTQQEQPARVVTSEEHEAALSSLLETIMERFQFCISEMSARHITLQHQIQQQQQHQQQGSSPATLVIPGFSSQLAGLVGPMWRLAPPAVALDSLVVGPSRGAGATTSGNNNIQDPYLTALLDKFGGNDDEKQHPNTTTIADDGGAEDDGGVSRAVVDDLDVPFDTNFAEASGNSNSSAARRAEKSKQQQQVRTQQQLATAAPALVAAITKSKQTAAKCVGELIDDIETAKLLEEIEIRERGGKRYTKPRLPAEAKAPKKAMSSEEVHGRLLTNLYDSNNNNDQKQQQQPKKKVIKVSGAASIRGVRELDFFSDDNNNDGADDDGADDVSVDTEAIDRDRVPALRHPIVPAALQKAIAQQAAKRAQKEAELRQQQQQLLMSYNMNSRSGIILLNLAASGGSGSAASQQQLLPPLSFNSGPESTPRSRFYYGGETVSGAPIASLLSPTSLLAPSSGSGGLLSVPGSPSSMFFRRSSDAMSGSGAAGAATSPGSNNKSTKQSSSAPRNFALGRKVEGIEVRQHYTVPVRRSDSSTSAATSTASDAGGSDSAVKRMQQHQLAQSMMRQQQQDDKVAANQQQQQQQSQQPKTFAQKLEMIMTLPKDDSDVTGLVVSPSRYRREQQQQQGDDNVAARATVTAQRWCEQAALFARELLGQVNARLESRGLPLLTEAKVRSLLYDSDSEHDDRDHDDHAQSKIVGGAAAATARSSNSEDDDDDEDSDDQGVMLARSVRKRERRLLRREKEHQQQHQQEQKRDDENRREQQNPQEQHEPELTEEEERRLRDTLKDYLEPAYKHHSNSGEQQQNQDQQKQQQKSLFIPVYGVSGGAFQNMLRNGPVSQYAAAKEREWNKRKFQERVISQEERNERMRKRHEYWQNHLGISSGGAGAGGVQRYSGVGNSAAFAQPHQPRRRRGGEGENISSNNNAGGHRGRFDSTGSSSMFLSNSQAANAAAAAAAAAGSSPRGMTHGGASRATKEINNYMSPWAPANEGALNSTNSKLTSPPAAASKLVHARQHGIAALARAVTRSFTALSQARSRLAKIGLTHERILKAMMEDLVIRTEYSDEDFDDEDEENEDSGDGENSSSNNVDKKFTKRSLLKASAKRLAAEARRRRADIESGKRLANEDDDDWAQLALGSDDDLDPLYGRGGDDDDEDDDDDGSGSNNKKRKNKDPSILSHLFFESEDELRRDALADLIPKKEKVTQQLAHELSTLEAVERDIRILKGPHEGPRRDVIQRWAEAEDVSLRKTLLDSVIGRKIHDKGIRVMRNFATQTPKSTVVQKTAATSSGSSKQQQQREAAKQIELAPAIESMFENEQVLYETLHNLSVASSNIATFINALEIDLTCRQCFCILDHPRTLACGHSVCSSCIPHLLVTVEDTRITAGTGDEVEVIVCCECGLESPGGYVNNRLLDQLLEFWNAPKARNSEGIVTEVARIQRRIQSVLGGIGRAYSVQSGIFDGTASSPNALFSGGASGASSPYGSMRFDASVSNNNLSRMGSMFGNSVNGASSNANNAMGMSFVAQRRRRQDAVSNTTIHEALMMAKTALSIEEKK